MFCTTDESDQRIEFRIQSAESFIRKYTNNFEDVLEYPSDVRLGVIGMLIWDIEKRDKIGISSETISRHSVTYNNATINSVGGYPDAVIAFLKPYVKARF